MTTTPTTMTSNGGIKGRFPRRPNPITRLPITYRNECPPKSHGSPSVFLLRGFDKIKIFQLFFLSKFCFPSEQRCRTRIDNNNNYYYYYYISRPCLSFTHCGLSNAGETKFQFFTTNSVFGSRERRRR